MQNKEFQLFSEKWADAHEIMAGGKVFSKRAMATIFETLEDYSLEMVSHAIKIHAKKSKFAPTPADIIEIISDNTGAKHIGAEEAWAIALESFDEYSTVVWTQPIAEARAIAWGIYMDGDKVAARMAFKDAYTRIIKTAPEPNWTVTEGFDMARRADAVQQAVLLKRLPQGADARYRLEAPTTTPQALIEQAHKITGKVDALEKLVLIKSILAIEEDDGVARREHERAVFETHRQNMLDKVDAKLQGELH